MQTWSQGLLHQIHDANPMVQFLGVAVAAGMTEEWAAIGVLGLARAGQIPWGVSVAALFCGTMAGNLLVFALGRFAEREALRWKPFRRLETSGKLASMHANVERRGWMVVVLSRFVPGTRIPVYLLAGILEMRWSVFALALSASTLVWIFATLGAIQVVIRMAMEQPWVLGGAVVTLAAAGWFYRSRSSR